MAILFCLCVAADHLHPSKSGDPLPPKFIDIATLTLSLVSDDKSELFIGYLIKP